MAVQDLMPLQLVYFVSVYRHRSYSKAAEAIPMSRQGLIRSIRRLENSLGDNLFYENGQLLSPSPKADELYDFVLNWFEELNELEDSFNLLDSSANAFSFADVSGVQGLFGIDYVQRFEEEHPAIKIDHHSLSDFKADDALLNREVDIAITANPFNELLQTTLLCEVGLCAIVRSDSSLALESSISIADLEGETMLLTDKGCKVNVLIENLLVAGDVHPKQEITTAEIFWIPSYVSISGGIGITAAHVARSLSIPSNVRCLPFRGATRQFGISKLRETKLTLSEKTFIEYLHQQNGGTFYD